MMGMFILILMTLTIRGAIIPDLKAPVEEGVV
jgi:hypothetical protein